MSSGRVEGLSEGTANCRAMKTSFGGGAAPAGGRGGGDAGLRVLGSRPGPAAAYRGHQAVDEQDAIQVVELMLKGARGEPVRLDAHLLPRRLRPLHYNRFVPRHLAHPARVAEAALVADLHTIALTISG